MTSQGPAPSAAPDSTAYDVIIVGAGHGGAQVAIALRQDGFEGSILMVGSEAFPPYERPPLSKEYLARDKSFDRILIRPRQFWEERGVELRLSTTVTSVDPITQTLTLENGQTLLYDKLVWATGGSPRRLNCPGSDLEGIHYVRDKADADRLMADLDAGARNVAVIGGGYIGLEAAAVLTKLGCQVTLMEALPRVLARVAGAQLSSFYEAEHRTHGVDLRTDTQVVAVEGANGSVTNVLLADGTRIPAEIVVVGIGIVPSVGPLAEAGAKGDNGVLVDPFCRTTLTNIFAIGDCAAHTSSFAGGAIVRLESVQNAHDMAKVVAKSIVGSAEPYHATPWFWSNQYDLKLQTVGLLTGYDEAVLRGDPASRSFSVIYLKERQVIALDCVNCVKDFVQGRKLVEAKQPVKLDTLADPSVPLKELIAG